MNPIALQLSNTPSTLVDREPAKNVILRDKLVVFDVLNNPGPGTYDDKNLSFKRNTRLS